MSTETPSLNPNALAVPDAVRVLSAVSRKPISVEMIERDVAAGAPTNPDGTINLVNYAAWLAREMGHGD